MLVLYTNTVWSDWQTHLTQAELAEVKTEGVLLIRTEHFMFALLCTRSPLLGCSVLEIYAMRSTDTMHSEHTVASRLEALKPHHTRNSWRKWDIVLGQRYDSCLWPSEGKSCGRGIEFIVHDSKRSTLTEKTFSLVSGRMFTKHVQRRNILPGETVLLLPGVFTYL